MAASLEEIIDIALDMGALMLECNSEIARCEKSIHYILESSGVYDINIFTLTTCIYLTASKDGRTVTRVKRIHHSSTNLMKISAMNQLSREIVSRDFPKEEAIKRLEEIKQIKETNDFIKSTTISLSCMAFGYMFYPNISIHDLSIIFMITFITYFFNKLLSLGKMNYFIHVVYQSIFMTFCVVLCHYCGIIGNIDHIIVGTIMYLVPGVAITNCVRDMLNGDVLSGTVRLVECLFIGLAIAAGVFITLYIYTRGTML